MTGERERLLVVDDDPRIAVVVRRGLTYEGYDVAVASSGEQALDLARDRPPDLVVLDVMLPGIDGLEVCRRLRSADADLPVLMLTARDSAGDEVAGLETGADDYVVKPFTFAVLLARVRALLRRRDRERPAVLHFADLSLDTGSRVASRGGRTVGLTTTEFQLLQEFLLHPRQVLTRDQLMERVWGYDFGGNENVLEVYVRYLRTKLEAGGEPRLIHTVRGAGYALREA